MDSSSGWMRSVLRFAALNSALWGAFGAAAPEIVARWSGTEPPGYLGIWQYAGMLVAVRGAGYFAASFDPVRYWPVPAAGLLAKLLGAAGFWMAAAAGHLPWRFCGTLIANELVWVLPFAAVLNRAWRAHVGELRAASPEILRMALRVRTGYGVSLDELSRLSPVLVVFLRHTGCTFCREALADLAAQRRRIEAQGTALALVLMSREADAGRFLQRYGLDDVHVIGDPGRSLYRAFGLGRGRLMQLFGPAVWWRGFEAAVFGRHGAGRLEGDGFQMPGVLLLFHGEVLRAYRHHTAADRPDYVALSSALAGGNAAGC